MRDVPSFLRVSSVAKIGYIPQFKASNARDQDGVSSDLARMGKNLESKWPVNFCTKSISIALDRGEQTLLVRSGRSKTRDQRPGPGTKIRDQFLLAPKRH